MIRRLLRHKKVNTDGVSSISRLRPTKFGNEQRSRPWRYEIGMVVGKKRLRFVISWSWIKAEVMTR
jgi:hypothetical protein